MEDAGLFGMFIVTDDYREKVLKMKRGELESVQVCMNWLQEHNIWSRVYKTNWEKLQQEQISQHEHGAKGNKGKNNYQP